MKNKTPIRRTRTRFIMIAQNLRNAFCKTKSAQIMILYPPKHNNVQQDAHDEFDINESGCTFATLHIKTNQVLSIFNAGSTSSHRGTYTPQNKQRFNDIQHWEHFIPQRNLHTSKQAKVYRYSITVSTSSHRGTYTHQNKQRFINIQRWKHFIPPTEEPIHIKTSKGLTIFNAGSTSSHRGTNTHQSKQRFIDIQRWEHFIPQRSLYTSKQAKV